MQFKIILILLSLQTLAQEKIQLPSSSERLKMFNQFVSEINRLDGEGLIPRYNRSENWESTTKRLALESQSANSIFELGRVFKRLNATYTNLHAKVHLIKELDQEKSEGYIKFPFRIQADLTSQNSKDFSYYIVNTDQSSEFRSGDKILEINDRPMEEIEKENFIFCKFPTRVQCALELESNLKKELLFWTRTEPLKLKILRAEKSLNLNVTFEVIPSDKLNNEEEQSCEKGESRYKNFQLDYKGYNLCAYKSSKYPGKLILRIKSFVYQSNDPITDLNAEVDMFWFNYWRKESYKISDLIIDVIGNYGGQSPIPYYALFSKIPFQEQYTQFKKISEFERKDIYESLFWGDKSKEIWFEFIKSKGDFTSIKEGEFLPPVPQFCVDQEKSCEQGMFLPHKHKFRGKIKILVDQWCISSCVGFVYNMKKLFKEKVQFFGHEDSGDSAYSRLTLSVMMNKNEASIQVQPLNKAKNPDLPYPWVRQVLSVTRSTDKEGQILSGIPQKIDHWVPRRWNQTIEEWSNDVFDKALRK